MVGLELVGCVVGYDFGDAGVGEDFGGGDGGCHGYNYDGERVSRDDCVDKTQMQAQIDRSFYCVDYQADKIDVDGGLDRVTAPPLALWTSHCRCYYGDESDENLFRGNRVREIALTRAKK